jgi:hypothetical protein
MEEIMCMGINGWLKVKGNIVIFASSLLNHVGVFLTFR